MRVRVRVRVRIRVRIRVRLRLRVRVRLLVHPHMVGHRDIGEAQLEVRDDPRGKLARVRPEACQAAMS